MNYSHLFQGTSLFLFININLLNRKVPALALVPIFGHQSINVFSFHFDPKNWIRGQKIITFKVLGPIKLSKVEFCLIEPQQLLE